MTFFQRLAGLLGPKPPGRPTYQITVRCNRCGEVIATPLDLRNVLSPDYDEDSGATTYVCRKVLMGQQRCFQQIEVSLRFDEKHKLLDRQITGGQFVEPPK